MLFAAGSAHAQRLAPQFATLSEPFAESAAPSVAVVAFGHPDDYRWEGALVGGIGLGLFSSWFAVGWCTYENPSPGWDCIAGGFLGLIVGGAIGAGVGGLVGGLIPKEKPAP